MDIYIEYVIIDNMAFDCLILFSVCKTMKLPTKWWRWTLGGVFGTICAFLSVYASGVFNILLKITALFFMSAICVGFNKKLLLFTVLTLAYTFLMGGAVIGLFFLFGVEFSLDSVIAYNSGVPLGVYLIAIVLFVVLLYLLINYFKSRKKIDFYVVDAKLKFDNKDLSLKGFCDSGNSLMHQDLPVCFAVGAVRKKVENKVSLDVLQGKATKICYQTMAGEATTLATIAEIEVAGNCQKVWLALTNSNVNVNYDLLLNNSFNELLKEEDNQN